MQVYNSSMHKMMNRVTKILIEEAEERERLRRGIVQHPC